MAVVKSWVKAFRLRTLPLALSTIAMGSFLAGAEGQFSWKVFGLAALTTLLLQVLSNLANDYGDSEHGADSIHRIGPSRTVQSGEITKRQMLTAICLFTFLALVSGLTLIYVALNKMPLLHFVIFLGIGIAAIAAAIKYTAGKNPYGYRGLGDLFVFLFFGIVGVGGSYYLYAVNLIPDIILPAIAMGLLSAGVLNMNNMRDHQSDAQSGKRSLVVLMGFANARWYHTGLIVGAFAAGIVYTLLNYTGPWQWLFLLPLPLAIVNLKAVWTNKQPQLLDKQLKVVVLMTLLFCITFGIGLLVV